MVSAARLQPFPCSCRVGMLLSWGILALAAASARPVVLPRWEPTYEMWRSTVVMPCNASGFLDPVFASKWGIVDVDWSNAKHLWESVHPMDCQEKLVEQARRIKMLSPQTRVFVYRNIVKALPWYTSVREKITDARYAGWFLRFKDGVNGSYHVDPCTNGTCSELYHDRGQTPAVCDGGCDCGPRLPCGEYLWDHRNLSLRQWLIDDFVMGPAGVGNELIDGVYLDDQWRDTPGSKRDCAADAFGGPLEEHVNCTQDIGLTQSDTIEMTSNWRETNAAVNEAIVHAGGWPWHLFRIVNGAPTKGGHCEAFFRSGCKPDNQLYGAPLMVEFSNPRTQPLTSWKQDLATFLLIRGPYAWIGYAWVGCHSGSAPVGGEGQKWARPEALDEDYGVPTGLCFETGTGSGVFKRAWSKAIVTMNCNTWQASIDPVVVVI